MSYRYSAFIDVQFRDCDALAHVNNAVYITYLEVARFAYCRDALGFKPDDALGPSSFIIARVECNFRSQVRFGDRVEVRTRIGEIGRSSFTFEYEMVTGPDGRVVADGKSVQVAFDYVRQQSMPVPDEFRARAEEFEQRQFVKPSPQAV